jgi:hypothetical protein
MKALDCGEKVIPRRMRGRLVSQLPVTPDTVVYELEMSKQVSPN